MKRIATVLVLVAMLSGCATYGGSKRVAKAGGNLMVASVAIAAATFLVLASSTGADPHDVNRAAVGGIIGCGVMMGSGIVLGVGGLIGMAGHDEAAEASKAPPPQPPERGLDDALTDVPRPEDRERADALIGEAVAAARAGNCGAVYWRGREVLKLDRESYGSVFARDVDIKRCLDAAAAPAQRPAPPSDKQAVPPVAPVAPPLDAPP